MSTQGWACWFWQLSLSNSSNRLGVYLKLWDRRNNYIISALWSSHTDLYVPDPPAVRYSGPARSPKPDMELNKYKRPFKPPRAEEPEVRVVQEMGAVWEPLQRVSGANSHMNESSNEKHVSVRRRHYELRGPDENFCEMWRAPESNDLFIFWNQQRHTNCYQSKSSARIPQNFPMLRRILI